jgi:hypothetical protein
MKEMQMASTSISFLSLFFFWKRGPLTVDRLEK